MCCGLTFKTDRRSLLRASLILLSGQFWKWDWFANSDWLSGCTPTPIGSLLPLPTDWLFLNSETPKTVFLAARFRPATVVIPRPAFHPIFGSPRATDLNLSGRKYMASCVSVQGCWSQPRASLLFQFFSRPHPTWAGKQVIVPALSHNSPRILDPAWKKEIPEPIIAQNLDLCNFIFASLLAARFLFFLNLQSFYTNICFSYHY